MPGGFCFDNCCAAPTCNVIICVRIAANIATGVVVTAKDGGTTIATGTTQTGDGCVVLDVGMAGTYTFHVAIHAVNSHFTDCDQDIAVNCGFTYEINFGIVFATGCISGVGLAGVTVSVAGYADQTTDVDGNAYYNCIPIGSYAYTITHPRFQTITGTWTAEFVLNADFGLAGPASGYQCMPEVCNLPVPNTLHGTDSQLGAVTITWTGTLWEGTLTQNFAAYCGCAAKTGVTIRYRWPAAPSDYRIVVATRNVGGSLCAAVGTPNTNFFPVVGGHSIACEPFEIIDTYDGGNCGLGGGPGPGIWQTDDPVIVTLTE
jgi:hypothetical protein